MSLLSPLEQSKSSESSAPSVPSYPTQAEYDAMDETQRKIANVLAMGIPNMPAATSLAMQAMMEEKLRYRRTNGEGAIVPALGWILDEWANRLEHQLTEKVESESSSSASSSTDAPSADSSSADYIKRLRGIVSELESNPDAEPVAVLAVKDANTAIPTRTLNEIVESIPNRVEPHGATAEDMAAEEDDYDDMTEEERREEAEAMEMIRQKYAEAEANGTLPTDDTLPPEILNAMRANRRGGEYIDDDDDEYEEDEEEDENVGESENADADSAQVANSSTITNPTTTHAPSATH